jgi:hypothetical protein
LSLFGVIVEREKVGNFLAKCALLQVREEEF